MLTPQQPCSGHWRCTGGGRTASTRHDRSRARSQIIRAANQWKNAMVVRGGAFFFCSCSQRHLQPVLSNLSISHLHLFLLLSQLHPSPRSRGYRPRKGSHNTNAVSVQTLNLLKNSEKAVKEQRTPTIPRKRNAGSGSGTATSVQYSQVLSQSGSGSQAARPSPLSHEGSPAKPGKNGKESGSFRNIVRGGW